MRRLSQPSGQGQRGAAWLRLLLLIATAGGVAWLWWKAGPGSSPPPLETRVLTPVVRTVELPPVETPPPEPLPGTAETPAAVEATNRAEQPPATSPPPQTPPPVIISLPPAQPATSSLPDSAAIPPPPVPEGYPRPVTNVLEAQVALVRRLLSPGSIDGVPGSQTRAALRVFQGLEALDVTGRLDDPTRARLILQSPALTNYVVVPGDAARLQPISETWLGKSQQSALEYETLAELVAERFLASPKLLRSLNPKVDWRSPANGLSLLAPNAQYPEPAGKAAFVRISVAERCLDAFDTKTNLLLHFPCSIAQRAEKRPYGELYVTVVIPNPNYTFDPDVFPESAEARRLGRKLILPPGPNNPVGVAWIGLDKPGYGIHGTPQPEQVGRTESHGCFRLANWNASYLLRLAWVGMPVYVLP